jgi:hypothetical protein
MAHNSGDTAAAVNRAQAAARDVREAADSCKVSALRDEGHSIAAKAQEVLSKIEERVGLQTAWCCCMFLPTC